MAEEKLPFFLTNSVKKYGAQPFIVEGNRETSYKDFYHRVVEKKNILSTRGIRKGAVVGILAQPGLDYLTSLYALWLGDQIAAPVSTRLPEHTVVEQLRAIGARALIFDKAPSTFTDSHLQLIDIAQASPLGTASPTETLAAGAQFRGPQEVTILFTSGSSSAPKAVVHTYANHYYSAVGAGTNLPLGPEDLWLLSLPLYHVGGLAIAFRCALKGAKVGIPGGLGLIDAIEHFKPSCLSLVPTQLKGLLAEPRVDELLTKARCILVGGAPLAVELHKRALGRGYAIYTTYGLTETASGVTASWEDNAALGTAGKVLPHREIRISSQGEILVRGKTLGRYFGKDGFSDWFHTGDKGTLTDSGELRVEGRVDHMFVSGGENIHPEEIESCLLGIGGIEQALVMAIPDAEYGQRPVALVQLSEPTDVESIKAELRRCLEAFKIPDKFYEWPSQIAQPGLKASRQGLTAWFFEKREQISPL